VTPAATVHRRGWFDEGAGQAAEQTGERGLLAVVEIVGDIEGEADERQVGGHNRSSG
jgi:hypothetical protein